MTTAPMSKAQWLEALAAEGLQVVQQGDWWNRERDDETGKVFGPVNGVVIHHTAGTNSLNLVIVGTSSLPGPLCHTYIPKSGLIYMISGGRANHAGTFAQNAHNAVLNETEVHPYPDSAEPVDGNDHYYGVEAENKGDGIDPWPWVQYVSMVKWATAICRHQGWTENSVIGHKEGTRRKVDPKGWVNGPDGVRFELTMNRFRADVEAALALPAGEWQTEEEDVALSAEDIAKVAAAVANKLIAGGGVLENDDVRRVWVTDNIIESPEGKDSANPYWAPASYVRAEYIKVERIEKGLAEVKAKVDSLSTGGVDLDALAEKVADVLHARLSG